MSIVILPLLSLVHLHILCMCNKTYINLYWISGRNQWFRWRKQKKPVLTRTTSQASRWPKFQRATRKSWTSPLRCRKKSLKMLWYVITYLTLTLWLMEPGGSMLHSQGLSNNPYPEPNQSGSEALCDVSEHPCFYSVRLLASRQTHKLEDHSWSAVHDCSLLFFFL